MPCHINATYSVTWTGWQSNPAPEKLYVSHYSDQGWIQDLFKGGLGGNSYIIYKNYIYNAIIHIIILINKVHVSTYCAWSYSLHAAVPAAAMHWCYYTFVVICSLLIVPKS